VNGTSHEQVGVGRVGEASRRNRRSSLTDVSWRSRREVADVKETIMLTTSRARVIAVLLAAVVLIGGANLAAYAANGKPLLLGKSNVESKKSILKNKGSGPALQLKTKPGQPPLAVNRTTKVKKLNADLVDGADAADLESLAYVYELTSAGAAPGHEISFPGLPPGRYLMNYTVITSGVQALCFTENRQQGLTYATAGVVGYSVNSGSAVLDTRAADDRLLCNGDAGNISIYSGTGGLSEVSFTRLDTISSQAPSLARTTTPRSRDAGPTGR
jgi:hypothetical protein